MSHQHAALRAGRHRAKARCGPGVQVQERLDGYASRYYVLKSPRKLEWLPHLGTVHFTLTVGSEQRDFTVSPLLATILLHFQVPQRLSMMWAHAPGELAALPWSGSLA